MRLSARATAGKARSATNSLHHYRDFCHQNGFVQTVAHNFEAEFQPVTPAQHTLLYRFFYGQLRFLYMEYLFGLVITSRLANPLQAPDTLLTTILRER